MPTGLPFERFKFFNIVHADAACVHRRTEAETAFSSASMPS
jgi:hypothetical protein